MDPLSVSASIAALLHIAKNVYQYGQSVVSYHDDIKKVNAEIDDYTRALEKLRRWVHQEETQHPERAMATLELFARRAMGKGEDGQPIVLEAGVVPRMKELIIEAGKKLYPDADWKRLEFVQRLNWPFKKSGITEMRTAIAQCLNLVNTALSLLQLEAAEATTESIKHLREVSESSIENIKQLLEASETSKERIEQVLNAQFGALQRIDERLARIESRGDEDRRLKEQQEKLDIMEWLSPSTFNWKAKQNQLWNECCKATGAWLWKDQRFDVWATGERKPWFIRANGALGVGKTVLSAIMSRRLVEVSPEDPLILSVYLDYKVGKAQNLSNLIGGLLRQILQFDQYEAVSDDLRDLYRRDKYAKDDTSARLREMLVGILAVWDRPFYIIVDGFDELPSGNRKGVRDILKKLLHDQGRLVILSRRISEEAAHGGFYTCNICKTQDLKLFYRCEICHKGNFDICYDCKAKKRTCLVPSHVPIEPYDQVEIEIEIPDRDIATYVEWAIRQSIGDVTPFRVDNRVAGSVDPDLTFFQNHCLENPKNQSEIVEAVTKTASGRFLYAKLHLESLKSQKNQRRLLKTLRDLPTEIDGIYDEAMQRIRSLKSDDRREALRILSLVGFARRPLRKVEMQHALAVLDLKEDADEDDVLDGFEKGALEAVQTILDTTSGLVVFEEDKDQFRLVHRSLEEYFRKEQNQLKYLPSADLEFARACLRYLQNFLPNKKATDKELTDLVREKPFLAYASQYWGDHVRRALASSEDHAEIQEGAFQLLNDHDRKNTCIRTAWITDIGGENTWDTGSKVDSLHFCAWYGLSFALSDPEVGTVDKVEPKHGQTPLMYACRRGFFDACHRLLELGASTEKLSSLGRSALVEAILAQVNSHGLQIGQNDCDHIKVIDLLLKTPAGISNINSRFKQEFDRTALMLAARRGLISTVQVLLQCQGIDVDLQDSLGYTALHLAAKENHVKVVQRLIESEASVNIPDFDVKRSPLRSAAEGDLSEVVKVLLENHADSTWRDYTNSTALLQAVIYGADKAVKVMLDRSVDITCVDESGQSLLHAAAKHGQISIINLLLDHTQASSQRLHVDLKDSIGMTPLHYASRSGQAKAASVLIENHADTGVRDNCQRSPYEVAWQYGEQEMMSILQACNRDSKIHTQLDTTQLPVWAMAKQQHTSAVELAVSVRPDDLLVLEPGTDNTALHWAIGDSEHDGILDILLEAGKIPINSSNRQKRTPLHYAAYQSDFNAADALTQMKPEIDIDAKDRWGETPLSLAEGVRCFDMANQLIQRGAQVDASKINLPRLFFHAVEQGDVGYARMLIEDHGVDSSMQNQNGLRALKIAEGMDDNEEMIAMLQRAPTVDFGALAENMANSRLNSNGEGEDDEDEQEALRKIKFTPFRARAVELTE